MEASLPALYRLALGGTAVGTGLNTAKVRTGVPCRARFMCSRDVSCMLFALTLVLLTLQVNIHFVGCRTRCLQYSFPGECPRLWCLSRILACSKNTQISVGFLRERCYLAISCIPALNIQKTGVL